MSETTAADNRRRPTLRRRASSSTSKTTKPIPRPLLFSRAETAALLGVSVATVRRLEQAGVLTGIRLNPALGDNAPVMHQASQVFALAGVEGAEDV